VTTSKSAIAGVIFTIALRLPWFDAALGRDEGGVSMVANAWHHSRPFPYGPYFLDRPPLLVAAYKVANDAGGAARLARRISNGLMTRAFRERPSEWDPHAEMGADEVADVMPPGLKW